MWLAGVASVVLIASVPARAGIIVSITSVSDAAGTNGDALDVTIQNTGSSAQNIAGFDLGLSVASSNILFTGGNESTALTYLFSGDSFDIDLPTSLTSVPPPNGQTVQASDFSNSGNGTNLAAGATLGLGHIIFNVAGGTTPGPITVTLAASACNVSLVPCTDLSDSNFNTVAFTAVNGTITVTGAISGVPEPASGLLAGLALAAIVAVRLRG